MAGKRFSFVAVCYAFDLTTTYLRLSNADIKADAYIKQPGGGGRFVNPPVAGTYPWVRYLNSVERSSYEEYRNDE